MTQGSNYENLCQAAREQGFKIIERADGHITFTSPGGQIIITRREGFEGTRSWGGSIRRLRRIGLQWPPTPSDQVESPGAESSPMQAFIVRDAFTPEAVAAMDSRVQAIWAAKETVRMRQSEELAVTQNDRGQEVLTAAAVSRLSENLRYLFPPAAPGKLLKSPPIREFAKFSGFSSSWLEHIRRKGLSGEYPVGAKNARRLVTAMNQWANGERPADANGASPDPTSDATPASTETPAAAGTYNGLAWGNATPIGSAVVEVPLTPFQRGLADLVEQEIAMRTHELRQRAELAEKKAEELRQLLAESQARLNEITSIIERNRS